MILENNSCGSCRLCCWRLTITANKRQNLPASGPKEWCAHCTATGCGLQERGEQKPRLCRGFACSYHENNPFEGWRPEERPDRSGVLWRATEVKLGLVQQVIECYPSALKTDVVEARIHSYLQKGRIVLATDNDDRCTYLIPQGVSLDTKTRTEIEQAGIELVFASLDLAG